MSTPCVSLSSLVSGGDEFEPLSQGVTEGVGQGSRVPEDHVEREGEDVQVRLDLGKLPWPLEDGNANVENRVLGREEGGVRYNNTTIYIDL